jgi:hypothetical protein
VGMAEMATTVAMRTAPRTKPSALRETSDDGK